MLTKENIGQTEEIPTCSRNTQDTIITEEHPYITLGRPLGILWMQDVFVCSESFGYHVSVLLLKFPQIIINFSREQTLFKLLHNMKNKLKVNPIQKLYQAAYH